MTFRLLHDVSRSHHVDLSHLVDRHAICVAAYKTRQMEDGVSATEEGREVGSIADISSKNLNVPKRGRYGLVWQKQDSNCDTRRPKRVDEMTPDHSSGSSDTDHSQVFAFGAR